jgi:hypothetical protein
MSAQQFVDHQVGYLIGFTIIAAILLPRRRLWVKRAHKLAVQSDIALPGPLVGRIARFLRNEILFSQLIVALTVPLLDAVLFYSLAHRNRAAWHPWILVGVPLYWAAACLALSLWPRWKASDEYRVTHLGTLPVQRAFTTAEFAAVNAGLVVSAALTAWGLWYAAASPIWWLACAIALTGAVAVGRYAVANIMNRPSSASDAIELGWDDLLRFRQVRAVTASVAWAPAAFVYLIDCLMSPAFFTQTTTPGEVSYQLRWWPIVVPVLVVVLLSGVFRQGRQLWRQAWLERSA